MLILVAGLAGAASAPYAQQTPSSAPATPVPVANTVFLGVTVTDRNGAQHVTGLQPGAFVVRERDRPLQITHFSSKAEPLSIGLVIDNSFSMESSGVLRVQQAVEKMVQGAHERSEYFVVGVPNRGTPLEWTRDRTVVLERVAALSRPGSVSGTDLHNTVMWSLSKLQSGSYTRRALIVTSDGEDTSSTVGFGQVELAFRVTSTTMFALVPVARTRATPSNPFLALPEKNAGRTLHLRRDDDAPSAGETIANDLRHQYLIGFTPPSTVGDDKWHPITLSVTVAGRSSNDIKILSKKGYFALK